MARRTQCDAVAILGTPPTDPDQLAVTPPNGFIWMIGSVLAGSFENYGVADVRVCHGGETMDFTITLADALALRCLLDRTIGAMRDLCDDAD